MQAGDAEPEGLAEYGADAELPEALLGAAAAYSGVGAMTRDPAPALLETLAGLHRLLAGRHLATVQEWLRVLVKVSTARGTNPDCRPITPGPCPSPAACGELSRLATGQDNQQDMLQQWCAVNMQADPTPRWHRHCFGDESTAQWLRSLSWGSQAAGERQHMASAQAEVGEPGSAGHAERERLLRTAIGLKARVTAAQDRYAAVRALLDASAAAPAAGTPVGTSSILPITD